MSAISNIAWAEQQTCGTPLEKLILITLASRCGSEGRLEINHAELAAYCCCKVEEFTDALDDLHRRRLLWSLDGTDEGEILAFPWWDSGKGFGPIGQERPFKWDLREVLMTAQDGQCWYCGTGLDDHPQTPHIEHQVPSSRGGPNLLGNLVLACAPCNISKNARTVSEYRKFVIQRDRKPKDFRFHGEVSE